MLIARFLLVPGFRRSCVVPQRNLQYQIRAYYFFRSPRLALSSLMTKVPRFLGIYSPYSLDCIAISAPSCPGPGGRTEDRTGDKFTRNQFRNLVERAEGQGVLGSASQLCAPSALGRRLRAAYGLASGFLTSGWRAAGERLAMATAGTKLICGWHAAGEQLASGWRAAGERLARKPSQCKQHTNRPSSYRNSYCTARASARAIETATCIQW